MNREAALVSLFLVAGVAFSAIGAEPLTSATLVEVRNTVSCQAQGAAEQPAKPGDQVRQTDVVRTGDRSLAELEFNDKTIARIGSKSVFSFHPVNREFEVSQGYAVVCVPKGAGGGRVISPSITAAIQGTTVLVFNNSVLFLEGTGIISTRDGTQSLPIHGGQIAQFVNGVLTIRDFDLSSLMTSRFFTSRSHTLPTWAQVQTTAGAQGGGEKPGGGGNVPGVVRDPGWRVDGIRILHPATCNCPPPPPFGDMLGSKAR